MPCRHQQPQDSHAHYFTAFHGTLVDEADTVVAQHCPVVFEGLEVITINKLKVVMFISSKLCSSLFLLTVSF